MLQRFLQVVPITCLVGTIYALWRFSRLKGQGSPIRWGRETVRLLFVCYLTGLFNLVLVPANLWSAIWFRLRHGRSGVERLGMFSGSFNFKPALVKCLAGELRLGTWVKEMLVGNVLMYLPLGFFLPLLSPKLTPRKAVLLALLVPLGVELLQPIVGRSFDVDDVLCNFLGVLLGYAVGRAVLRLTRKDCK